MQRAGDGSDHGVHRGGARAQAGWARDSRAHRRTAARRHARGRRARARSGSRSRRSRHRLAWRADPRSRAAIESLIKRPDDASRREVATGLATAGGPVALQPPGPLLRDASPEVALAAIRPSDASTLPGAADGAQGAPRRARRRRKGLPRRARDHRGARADAGPAAGAALEQLASRRALIKRGHFSEVTDLARQGLAQRAKEAGR